MIVPLSKSKKRHPDACLSSLPSPTQVFLTRKVFTKSFPFSQLLSQNLAKTLLVSAPGTLFSCRDRRPRKRKKNWEQGEVFVKFFSWTFRELFVKKPKNVFEAENLLNLICIWMPNSFTFRNIVYMGAKVTKSLDHFLPIIYVLN